MAQKNLTAAIRLLLSAFLISIIVYYVDFKTTLQTLTNVRLKHLLMPLLMLFFQAAISAYKWKLILAVEKAQVGFWFLLKTNLIGQFISLFLPSSIGGDVYRIARIKSRVAGFSLRFSSVIFDRVSGLYGLLLIAAAGSTLLLRNDFTLVLSASLLALPILFFVVTSSGIAGWLGTSRYRILQMLGDVLMSQRRFVTSWALLPIMTISVLFHFLVVVINFLYCQALSLEIRFIELWAIIPLVYITDMIPLSINGIGIRDSAYVVLFRLLGYLPESAFALSLLMLSMRYFFGTLGGLLLLGDILTKNKSAIPIHRNKD